MFGLRRVLNWASLSIEEVSASLKTDLHQGLTDREGRRRLKSRRDIGESTRYQQVAVLILRQFASPLVYILLAAGIIALIVGHERDAILITTMLALEIIIGFIQEYKADQALKYLKKISPRQAKVIRGGQIVEMPAKDVVRGDIVIIGEGENVPADIRLVHCDDLLIDESQLTGESAPVKKCSVVERLAGSATRIQPNLAYWGTAILSGHGRGVIVAVGADVRFAKTLAAAEAEPEEASPLEKEVRRIAYMMLVAAVIFVAAIFILTVIRHYAWQEGVSLVVNLFVAIIPEGLPVIATVILATAATRMARHKALTRRLSAAETLGNIDLILTDKTGTLTTGQMQARNLWASQRLVKVANNGAMNMAANKNIKDLVLFGCLASQAHLTHGLTRTKGHGDPVDVALLSLGYHLKHESQLKRWQKLDTIAFQSKQRYMAVLRRREGRHEVFVKGAPDELLRRAAKIIDGRESQKLTQAHIDEYNSAYHQLASTGRRVIAVAYKAVPRSITKIKDSDVASLTLVGLVGIEDPPHAEARATIEELKEAGIKVKMVTGDLPSTAFAIGREVGIAHRHSRVLTGEKVSQYLLSQPTDGQPMTDHRLDGVDVFARMTPELKLELVQYYQAQGYRVAVTGDGVNDAAALKVADIGIALAGQGSEVARETSDLVLTDNNFATLGLALKEGRTVWANFRKVIFFLLSTDLAEVLIILGALIMSYKVPFSPIQILWINLVIDTLACQALAFEPSEGALKERHGRSLLPGWLMGRIVLVALWQSALVIFVYWWGTKAIGQSLAATLAFVTLAAMQIINVFNARSLTKSIFNLKHRHNYWLYVSVATTIILMLLALYYAPLRNFLGLESIAINYIVTAVLVALSIVGVIELDKIWYIKHKFRNKGVLYE
jgi:Ca2+-transporting ATPase